jgi:hypothetical protein
MSLKNITKKSVKICDLKSETQAEDVKLEPSMKNFIIFLVTSVKKTAFF